MDLSRQLKNAITTGTLLFGQRQAKDACAEGNAKMIIIAAYMGHDAVCKLLLAHKADARYRALAKDDEPFLTAGGSAADVARGRGHGPLAAMLDKHD